MNLDKLKKIVDAYYAWIEATYGEWDTSDLIFETASEATVYVYQKGYDVVELTLIGDQLAIDGDTRI